MVVGAGHEYQELLAAAAHDDVGLAQHIEQQPGRAHQDLVTGGVAEAVVDLLEVVEVEHRHGESSGKPLGGRALELSGEGSGGSVVRRSVAVRLVAQPLLEHFELSGAQHELGVGRASSWFLAVSSSRLPAGGGGLQRGPLEAELELVELAEGLALDSAAARARRRRTRPGRGAQLGGQRGQDEAADLRYAPPSQASAPSPDCWASSNWPSAIRA